VQLTREAAARIAAVEETVAAAAAERAAFERDWAQARMQEGQTVAARVGELADAIAAVEKHSRDAIAAARTDIDARIIGIRDAAVRLPSKSSLRTDPRSRHAERSGHDSCASVWRMRLLRKHASAWTQCRRWPTP
jgi:hypothetical protein